MAKKKKAIAPAKAKAKAKARAKAPAKGGKAGLPSFTMTEDGKTTRLGVLFSFSYDSKAIRRWVDAYEMLEAFNEANGTKATLAPMHVFDRFMEKGVIDGMVLMGLSPMMVPGIVAHEAAGKPIGESIACKCGDADVVVRSTGKHAGLVDVALWLADPRASEIVRSPGRVEIVADDDRWTVIPRPATNEGWYYLHEGTPVPAGDAHESEPQPHPERGRARSLIANRPGEPFVGALVRDSSRSRVSHGYGLGSVTAFVVVGDEDAKRVKLGPPPGGLVFTT